MDKTSLSGQTALVTGASRGIGRAIAFDLAQRGARVAVHYNSDQAKAEECLAYLGGGPHLAVKADISRPEAAEELVNEVMAQFGRLDVLVNNAGIYEFHPVATASFEEWRLSWERTINTNLMGPAHLCFHAAQRMMAAKSGRIINITSRGAFRGEPDAPAYGAAKAGLNSAGQSLAQALAPHGVRVFTVAPGFVETDMTTELLEGPVGAGIKAQSPLNRAAQPEEIAGLVGYLAAEGPEFLTGCIVDINGASYLRN